MRCIREMNFLIMAPSLCCVAGLILVVMFFIMRATTGDSLEGERRSLMDSRDTFCQLVRTTGNPRCVTEEREAKFGPWRHCACAVALKYDVGTGGEGSLEAEVLLEGRGSRSKWNGFTPAELAEEPGLCAAAVQASPWANLVTYAPGRSSPWLCSTETSVLYPIPRFYKWSWVTYTGEGNLCTEYNIGALTIAVSGSCTAPPMNTCLEAPSANRSSIPCAIDTAKRVRLGRVADLLVQLEDAEANQTGYIGILVIGIVILLVCGSICIISAAGGVHGVVFMIRRLIQERGAWSCGGDKSATTFGAVQPDVGGPNVAGYETCPRCHGVGQRGVFGPVGLGLLARECSHCVGQGKVPVPTRNSPC